VATEVKQLANQTSTAIEDIRKRVVGIPSSTAEAVNFVTDIDAVIGQVNSLNRSIASSVEGQSTSTKDIVENVKRTRLSSIGLLMFHRLCKPFATIFFLARPS
jgi:methyl-accepting chemotaxis protein